MTISTNTSRIGRYELLEPVGRGAMGIVYRADDPLIRRIVAVKILHSTPGLTPQQIETARERFCREAQTAGSIDHPNIVRIFDVGEKEDSGELYIVMEYVPGRTLEELLNEGALEFDKAAEIIGQVASGLDAAHVRGIIHRDIKPSNVLVAQDGSPKIVDFGITHVATSSLTRDMRELGTPAYMSPEQINGKALDPRADLFSLGVMSYEILAGRKPFDGADVVAIAHAIAYAQPLAISIANSELPRALDRVLERMLAKEPRERFASGREFHDALLACRADGKCGRSSAPADLPKRRRVRWGLAGVITVAAAALVMLSWGERATSRPKNESPVSLVPVAPKATQSGATATVSAITPVPKKQLRSGGAAKKSSGRSDALSVVAKPSPPKTINVPRANLAVSLVHRMRHGTLTVSSDGVAVFSEAFSKSKLALRQTTKWNALDVSAGRHEITARVDGDDGKTYLSDPHPVDFPGGAELALQVSFNGKKLIIKQKSG